MSIRSTSGPKPRISASKETSPESSPLSRFCSYPMEAGRTLSDARALVRNILTCGPETGRSLSDGGAPVVLHQNLHIFKLPTSPKLRSIIQEHQPQMPFQPLAPHRRRKMISLRGAARPGSCIAPVVRGARLAYAACRKAPFLLRKTLR